MFVTARRAPGHGPVPLYPGDHSSDAGRGCSASVDGDLRCMGRVDDEHADLGRMPQHRYAAGPQASIPLGCQSREYPTRVGFRPGYRTRDDTLVPMRLEMPRYRLHPGAAF